LLSRIHVPYRYGAAWRSRHHHAASLAENRMTQPRILRLGSVKDLSQFKAHLDSLKLKIPLDRELLRAPESPLAQSLLWNGRTIGNRICIQPMEGWDGTPDGNPSANTIRRWQRFGQSGAKLIWGGEAVAVCHEGRANPNQLVATPQTKE